MSEPAPNLIHEFTYRAACEGPREAGCGPFGRRQFYKMTDGVVEGARLRGGLAGSGGDWMLVGDDGFLRMDVRIQIETDDGAIIGARYFGPAEANQTLMQALATRAPTRFSDQSIGSHWVLESGEPRYAWVNQTAFIGQGRLCPAADGRIGFEHRVYRLG
ncbi:DUF3237 domain-containing protein [Lichenicoccus sp.]|uniref:DUF3237 domain-containing protein n=1 Tax=Lichenicoccus sp. TaxID=2781899 RepID=UPI003D1430CC